MDNNSSFGGGNGTGSDQPGQTPAAPVMGGMGGIQTPPPVVEPTVPGSVPPIGGSDPVGVGTPPVATPVDTGSTGGGSMDTGMPTGAPVTPTAENPEQSGGTGGGTTTGM